MEEDCCQRVVSQLCGALSHLHSLGFVHRDLKPENVFLCDSVCRWVKLGDFGMVSVRRVLLLISVEFSAHNFALFEKKSKGSLTTGEGQRHQGPRGLVQLPLLHP